MKIKLEFECNSYKDIKELIDYFDAEEIKGIEIEIEGNYEDFEAYEVEERAKAEVFKTIEENASEDWVDEFLHSNN